MLYVLASEKNISAVKKHITPILSAAGISRKFLPVDKGMPALEPGCSVLSLGTQSLNLLKAQGVVPKNRAVGSLRSRRHEYDGRSFFVSYDPAIIDIDSTKEPDVVWDTKLAARWVSGGTVMPPLGQYRWVEDFNDALTFVGKRGTPDNPVSLAIDLETIGLDEFAEAARIVSVSVTYRPGQADVLEVPNDGTLPPVLRDQLITLCQSDAIKTVGANLKFDARWIKQHWGFWITNQKFDTNLVGGLLNENRSNSLNTHAKVYTNMGGYDDPFNNQYDKGRMDEVLETSREDFLIYAGGDTDACYRAMTPIKNELLNDKALTNFYVRLLQPAANAFAVMEHRGVVVDHDQYDRVAEEVKADIDRVNAQLIALLPGGLKTKYRDDLSITRPVIVRDFMFSKSGLNLTPQMVTAKAKLPSTAMEHLEMFQNHPDAAEFVSLMGEFNSANKTLGTYVTGFRKHLRRDGRFHPTYLLARTDYGDKDAGTVTGRLSAKDPAWQTVPKHTKWAKLLRSVYVPPPGYAILKVDYSQGELRVTACIANEKTMIQTYREGLDLHLRTGSRVFGMDFEKAMILKAEDDPLAGEIRQGGKAGNFGLIYGMQANGFQNYARKSYGVDLTMGQVRMFIDGFFEEYAGLKTWHEKSIKMAHRWGLIRSPLGRIRHLPLINSRSNDVRSLQERQAINSPVQSTLSDLMLLAISILNTRYPDLWMFGMTHDEVACYVPEDQVEEWAIRIKEVMENLPLKENFGWDPQLPFLADAEASNINMASCKELKL